MSPGITELKFYILIDTQKGHFEDALSITIDPFIPRKLKISEFQFLLPGTV